MKNLILTLLVSTISWQVSAQSLNTELVCVYRAEANTGSVSDVVMRFTKDRYGRPHSGSIRVEHPTGELQLIRIPGRDIAQMVVGTGSGTELGANIHVRSYDVDLVLNYSGNDFLYDVQDWTRARYPTIDDMIQSYTEMLELGLVRHRVSGWSQPLAQMTGSVRWQGSLRKFASSKFVCTTEL